MGWVNAAALVFFATGAFAGHEVRVSAFDAGAFDWFVDVEHDFMLGGELDGALVVENAVLRVVELFAVHAGADIAGLEVADAVLGEEGVGGIHLGFVVFDVAGGFVVGDKLDAVLLAIGDDLREVEIRVGFGEAEVFAVVDPVAVPADVPAFDEEGGDAEFAAGIDVAFGIFGSGAVAVALAPSFFAEVETPPDTHVFGRMDPVGVGQKVGFVEVEHHTGGEKVGDGVGNDNGAPRRDPGGFEVGAGAV